MNKSNLDEMQERKLLKIEHNAAILTNVALFAVIMIQLVFFKMDGRMVIGELAVFLLSSGYVMIACIRNGIWDKSGKKPTMEKASVYNLIVSFCYAVIWGISSYLRYHKPIGSVAVFVFMFVMMFAFLFVVSSVLIIAYNRCDSKLEQLADQDEQEEL